MNFYVIFSAAITLISGLLLVLRYRWFIKCVSARDDVYQSQPRKDILNKSASYSKYQKTARKASVPNRPARTSGDFLDFFLSYSRQNNKNEIEGMLSSVDCGEEYE